MEQQDRRTRPLVDPVHPQPVLLDVAGLEVVPGQAGEALIRRAICLQCLSCVTLWATVGACPAATVTVCRPMGINVRRLAIEVFCETVLLHGVVESGRRLTDLANEREPFLAINDIETYPYAGDTMIGLQRHRRGLVNKDSIVLLAERDAAAPEASGVAEMRIAKIHHRILVYTNQFAVNADIHLPVGADLEAFLEGSQGQFVPLTNATATPMEPVTPLTSFRRHFLLINRDHIAYLGTADEGEVGAVAKDSETIS